MLIALLLAIGQIVPTATGLVAEWLRSGLQIRVPQFNSGRGLQFICSRPFFALLRASAGAPLAAGRVAPGLRRRSLLTVGFRCARACARDGAIRTVRPAAPSQHNTAPLAAGRLAPGIRRCSFLTADPQLALGQHNTAPLAAGRVAPGLRRCSFLTADPQLALGPAPAMARSGPSGPLRSGQHNTAPLAAGRVAPGLRRC